MLLVITFLLAVRALRLLGLLGILANKEHLVVKSCFFRMRLWNQEWYSLCCLSVSHGKKSINGNCAHHVIHLESRMIGESTLAFLHLTVDLSQILMGTGAALALQLLKGHILLLELWVVSTSRFGSFLNALSSSSGCGPQRGATIISLVVGSNRGLVLFCSALARRAISLRSHIRTLISCGTYVNDLLGSQ